MKKSVFFFFSLLFVSCADRNGLEKIDEILDNEAVYEQRFRTQIDSLEERRRQADNDSVRFSLTWALSEKYKTYNIDTCLTYTREMQRLARNEKESIIATSAMIYALASLGEEDDALKLYQSLPEVFPYDEQMQIYYESAHHLFLVMSELNPEKKDSCAAERHRIRQRLLQHDSTSYFALTYLFHEKRYFGQEDEAIRTAASLLKTDSLPVRYRAINEYNLARGLMNAGHTEEAVDHYINAAILDLTTATKEYNSLFSLARYLHRGHDNKRACRYIIKTMNDAVFCNYKSHYIRSSEAALLIHQAFLRTSEARTRQQIELIFILGLLLALTALMLVFRQIYSTRERRAHEQIRQINARLEDGNKIRDNILSDYMEKSAYYIGKVDEMKSEMRRTYRSEGEESLLRMLRSPGSSDAEFKRYLQEFDDGILRLFPDFVEQVNQIMDSSHQLSLTKNGSFSTELRILAIIRMGITDSAKIAKALNISVGTTYSYRYRMRHGALCTAEEFDSHIQKIGL